MDQLISTIRPVWQFSFLGNTIGQYLVALFIFMAIMAFSKMFNYFFEKYLHAWAEKTATTIDDLIVKNVIRPLYFLLLLLGIYFAKNSLKMPDLLSLWTNRLMMAVGILIGFIYLFRFLEALMERGGERYIERLELENPPDLEERKRTVERVIKQIREVGLTIFIIVAILTLLANLGIDLKAIWASLGIGGIAVVVAVKDPLTNVVGRIYILSTGIFDEGHFIVFKNWSGTVKRIGFFRTYLELFSDMTTVSIPNAQFINEGVKNYYGRKKFMYKWDLDVPYDISGERIEALIEDLRDLILNLPEINPNMCWIYLERLDRYAKVVRVWFQVNLTDWATSLFYGSRVLKQIQERFATQKIDFAFPTSTVHLHGTPGGWPDPASFLPDISEPAQG